MAIHYPPTYSFFRASESVHGEILAYRIQSIAAMSWWNRLTGGNEQKKEHASWNNHTFTPGLHGASGSGPRRRPTPGQSAAIRKTFSLNRKMADAVDSSGNPQRLHMYRVGPHCE